MNLRRIALAGVAASMLFAAPYTSAQDAQEGDIEDPLFFEEIETSDELFDDLDSLFGDEMIDEEENPEDSVAPEAGLLQSDRLEWGGRLSGSTNLEWGWTALGGDEFAPLDPETRTLSPSVRADLFFDARPNIDFRAFGKLKLTSSSGDGGIDLTGVINDAALTGDLPEGWTREEAENGDTVIRDENGDEVFTVPAEDPAEEEEEEPQTGSPPAIDLSVYELFADFDYRDRLFFRFGKHTIQWGVGYFFSPADVLNLTAVDAEDPTADREGPVSLKVQFPFALHNAYLYVITNAGAKPLEVAVAPKLELVAGTTEFTFAGYYQEALAPRLIAMVTTTVGEIDLFGEAVVSFGSDRVFVRESRKGVDDFDDPPEGLTTVLDTYTVDLLPLATATAGFRYLKDFDEKKAGSIAALGQYFFNGEGYPDSMLLKPAAFLLQNTGTNGLAVGADAQPEAYEPPPDLRVTDLRNWGRHYAAASIGWNGIGGSDVSLSVFTLMNLSDLSGIVSPSVRFPLFDSMSVALSGRLTFGNPGDEYTNPAALIDPEATDSGGTFALTAAFGLGGGSF
jgi:hypothetical protein